VSRLRSFALAVRTNGPAAALRPLVRERLQLLAPQLPVVSVRTVGENMDQMLLTERLVALLSGLFGGIALMLTCLGLYGVMSYITARRTPEIGIRMALGAGRAATIGLVMKESLRQVCIGLALGVPAALLLMRALRAVLFGVTVTDAPTIAAAVMVMGVVAATASYLPARRATRVSALAALRCD
jgi:ABC-type antimicrobial peptide transport system permease subunit